MPDPIPFLTNTHQRNVLARSTASLGASFSRTMGAQFDEVSQHSATTALIRSMGISDLADLTGGVTGMRRGTAHGHMVGAGPNRRLEADQQLDQEFVTTQKENRLWAGRDEALEEIKLRGYTENEIPISDIGANLLVINEIMNRKDAQRKRQDIISRGSEGRGTALFMAGLAASLTDPIELGVNFIPWIGVARRLSALQKAGKSTLRRFGVRARFGAIEGVIGSAAIEPFPLIAAQMDHLDYDIEDSIMNVVYGAVIGTGMHMGIGYLGDRLTVARGGSLVEQPVLNKGPQGTTGAILDGLPPEVLKNNIEIAVNASIQNRNLNVDEFIGIGNIKIQPGQRMEIGGGRTLAVDKNGNAAIFDTTNRKATLEDIIDDPTLPAAVRDLARTSTTIDELAARIQKANNTIGGIDKRNVNALREVLTKQEAKPLSTFLEENGGLKADEIFDEFFETKNRPKLFKKKGGMTQNEAIKKARAAGYDIPQGKGEFFLKSLKEDVQGKNRILTTDAEAKLNEHAASLRSTEGFDINRIANRQTDDLLGFSEGFQSPQNIRGFDSERSADINRLIEKHDDFTTEDLTTSLDELQVALKDLSDELEAPGLNIARQIETIDENAGARTEGLQKITNCLIGGGV